MKRVRIPAEVVYIAAIVMLSLSVAMAACTGFGISMIAAPAYILSEKLPLRFGQCEYIVQGLLFASFCVLMQKVRLVITLCNGFLIGKCSDFFDKHLKAEPLFPRFAAHFDLER